MFLFTVIPGFTGQNELFPIACHVDSAYGECYSALIQKMVNLQLSLGGKMTSLKRAQVNKSMCIASDSRSGVGKNVLIKVIQIHNFWLKKSNKAIQFCWPKFFHRWSYKKKKKKYFPAPMKWYNIPRYKSFTDEATQLPSILENVSITAILKIVSIKATEFSSQFGGKIGADEKNSLAP